MATEQESVILYRRSLENHTRDILKDIQSVPKSGTPGFLLAYGSKVYPQVISTESNILICAAEYSQGRIVVATHDSYGNGFLDGSQTDLRNLQENIISWLSKGQVTDRSQYAKHILQITDDASVSAIGPNTKIIFWVHSEISLSSESQAAMAEFVANGGGLFFAVTPWAYLVYLSPNIPLHSLFREIGMTFSDNYDVLYGSDNGFAIELNDAYFNNMEKNNLYEFSKNESQFLESDSLLRNQKYLMTMALHSEEFKTQMKKVYDNNSTLLQIPTKTNPVKSAIARSMLVLSDLLSRLEVPGMEISPGAGHFPGIALDPAHPDQSSPLAVAPCQDEMHKSGRTVELEFISTTRDIFPTGCYANPSQKVRIEVISGSSQGWKIKIGAHSDYLNPKDQSELRRYFDVHVSKELTLKTTEVVSPYGGIMQLESPDVSEKRKLRLRLWNVLMTPFFDLKDDLCSIDWEESKKYPGTWADITGEHFMVTLPRSSVQNLPDPSRVMAKWDRLVRLMHFLRGTDVTSHRKQWLVTDEQPSTGYLHMGYPIVSHLDLANPSNESFVLSGNWSKFWGIYHEIGHNLQRDAWTFEGSLEVTCNIFSMYCMHHVTGNSPINCEWVQLQMPGIREALQSGEYDFDKWKSDPTIGIGIYAQLCEHLGWGCICDVLRHYESSDVTLPQNDQEKIDVWFSTCSKSSQVNLAPLFDFWEWPISLSCKNDVSNKGFPMWLPDDEITQMDPARVEALKKKYPNMERSVNKREFPYVFESSSKVLLVT